MNTPNHLGGHLNKVHTDRGALLHIKDKFNIKSMLDVGCGPGWMLEIAQARGMRAIGIDGDISLRGEWKRQEITVVEQDFTLGPADIGKRKFDLGWSVYMLCVSGPLWTNLPVWVHPLPLNSNFLSTLLRRAAVQLSV